LLILPLALLAFLRSETGGSLLQRGRRHIPGLMLRDQPLARSAIGSERWRRHLVEVERRVREGSTLSRALASGAFVPTTAVRLIEVGERSGQLADTCEKASSIMGEGARARIDRIVSLANPIAIVTLGGIVAMLVAGVMLGIFALGDFAG
jgi:type II secretory pathway component PulF